MKNYDKETVDKHFDETYDKKLKEINDQLEKKVTFVVIGDINSGKSSTINQIIGDEVAKVGAQPGETVSIDMYEYKNNIFFADTPGLDDIVQEHSELTLKYYKEADV